MREGFLWWKTTHNGRLSDGFVVTSDNGQKSEGGFRSKSECGTEHSQNYIINLNLTMVYK